MHETLAKQCISYHTTNTSIVFDSQGHAHDISIHYIVSKQTVKTDINLSFSIITIIWQK